MEPFDCRLLLQHVAQQHGLLLEFLCDLAQLLHRGFLLCRRHGDRHARLVQRPELSVHVDQDLRLGIVQAQLALLDLDDLLVDFVLAPVPVEGFPVKLQPQRHHILRHKVDAEGREVMEGRAQVRQVLRLDELPGIVRLLHRDFSFFHLGMLGQRQGLRRRKVVFNR